MNGSLKLLVCASLGLTLVMAGITTATAEDFYEGKTIRFVVGFSPGGGFDTYTRAIARHIGKHIPGKPDTIVENMAGAGSLATANYIYNKAKPDGLTIGNWIGGFALQQIMGEREGIDFDTRKFEWVGVPVSDSNVCALTKASGVTSIDKWFAAREPVKIGGITPGSTNSDLPRILKAALGLPIHLIEGYKGTAQVRLAAESGEVAGGCWAWQSIKTTWTKGIESGAVKVVLQAVPTKIPDLPGVPNAIDLAKTKEERQLIQAGILDTAAITRVYGLPPGTPKDRVTMLQKAFMNTMKDSEFQGEAKKAMLDISPKNGEEVAKIVKGLFELPPAMVTKLRDILIPKG